MLSSVLKRMAMLSRARFFSIVAPYRQFTEVSTSVITEFERIVGKENCSTAQSVRHHHATDESYHRPVLPEVVLFPQSTAHVSECVKICNNNSIPVIPYGTGTGMEGGVVPVHGGVVFNLTKIDRVLSASAENFTATVEPGVTRKGINNYLKDFGIWFPIDPGADASVCGMAATSASGTNAVRYGTMRENVLNLEVVLADGSVMWTAGEGLHCRKTSAGYNLTNLFVGSEGTLGLITKATIKLYGIPESMVSAVCHFPDVKSAVEATVMTLQAGVPVARIELLDDVQMKACISYSKLERMKPVPTLFLEFHGSKRAVEDDAKLVGSITASCGGSQFAWASDMEERNKLWTARHNALYASLSLRPGSTAVVTDVAVPITNLPEIISYAKDDITKSDLLATIVGHVGDGNFHSCIVIDPENKEELKRAKQVANRMALKAISLGGTCTGEHGVGLGKMDLVSKQRGSVALQSMKAIKQAFDPKGIMNPGKVLL